MCRVDYADDDGMWLRPLEERTARKEHRCDDCRRTIAAKERYTYGVYLHEGDVLTVKCCAHCVAAGKWLRVVCGGHLWPGVMEELREHWDEEWDLRTLGLGRLVVTGERKWQRNGRLVSTDDIAGWVWDALTHTPAKAFA